MCAAAPPPPLPCRLLFSRLLRTCGEGRVGLCVYMETKPPQRGGREGKRVFTELTQAHTHTDRRVGGCRCSHERMSTDPAALAASIAHGSAQQPRRQRPLHVMRVLRHTGRGATRQGGVPSTARHGTWRHADAHAPFAWWHTEGRGGGEEATAWTACAAARVVANAHSDATGVVAAAHPPYISDHLSPPLFLGEEFRFVALDLRGVESLRARFQKFFAFFS